jgi:hypothetical protein
MDASAIIRSSLAAQVIKAACELSLSALPRRQRCGKPRRTYITTKLSEMSFTVVPLHNLNLPIGTRIPFGRKFVIQDVPEWLKKDSGFLEDIARHDRVSTLEAKQALVSEYEAASIGEPDPEWTGHKPRGIQDLRFQSAMLANMAMWVVQPSTVCFTVGFHALTPLDGARIADPPIILRSERDGPLYCHPRDQHNQLSRSTLSTLQRITKHFHLCRGKTLSGLRFGRFGLHWFLIPPTIDIRFSGRGWNHFSEPTMTAQVSAADCESGFRSFWPMMRRRCRTLARW